MSIWSMNRRLRPSSPSNPLNQGTLRKILSVLFGRAMIREFMQNSASCLASRVFPIRLFGGKTISLIGILSAFEIGVPFSQFDKAETAIKDAYGGENEPASEEVAVPLELPEFVEPSESRAARDPERWYPEDATVEIWEGDQPEMGELLAASLGENQIHARVAEAKGGHRLLVLPEDETRAREIVRQVVEGVPPA
jgi:hypothetical protein